MKKIIATTSFVQKYQLQMINEFVNRRYKELYDQDIGGYIGEEYADITTSHRGSIDFVHIGEYLLSIDQIRIAQEHNIPCDIVQRWFSDTFTGDNTVNLRNYYLKTEPKSV